MAQPTNLLPRLSCPFFVHLCARERRHREREAKKTYECNLVPLWTSQESGTLASFLALGQFWMGTDRERKREKMKRRVAAHTKVLRFASTSYTLATILLNMACFLKKKRPQCICCGYFIGKEKQYVRTRNTEFFQ